MTNCGVPIVFVINKSDSPDHKYEEKTEFILRHIRKHAINYGASVIYTSTKSNSNISVLYDYIFYSLFNCDLVHKPNMIDKNSFFIPSGYDRLSVLKSNDSQNDLDYEYTDVIKEEKEEKLKEENEIKCEKVSDYLKKVKDRTYKSRKSMIRNDLQSGKSILQGIKELNQKNEIANKEKDKNLEKVDKFQKFRDKKESKPIESESDKPKLTQEERAKITRESLLNKLKISKNKK